MFQVDRFYAIVWYPDDFVVIPFFSPIACCNFGAILVLPVLLTRISYHGMMLVFLALVSQQNRLIIIAMQGRIVQL
jgi:hypothetical protein